MVADQSLFRRIRISIVLCLALCLTLSAVGSVALAGSATAAPAAVDDEESIDTGSDYEGTVGPNDSTDHYTFTADRGEYIRVTTYSGSPDAVDATLYGPDGDRLGGHEVYVEHIGFGTQAPASGEYTVEFTTSRSYEQDYQFEVETASDDGVGNTRESASSLDASSTERAVVGEGDEDYWSIDVPQPGELSVNVDNEGIIGAGVAVEVIDPDGDVIARSETNCTPGQGPCDIPELTPTADSSGEYYVRVSDAGVPGFNRYSIAADAPSQPTATESPDEERHRIAVSSDGERINYEFDVSGNVEKVDTDTEESVSGGHAEGVVVDGTDVFEYTGEITAFEDDGDPTVEIDGDPVDPESLGDTPEQSPTETEEPTDDTDETQTATPTEETPTATATPTQTPAGDASTDDATAVDEGTATPTDSDATAGDDEDAAGSGDAGADAGGADTDTETETAATPSGGGEPTSTPGEPTTTEAVTEAASENGTDDAGASFPENDSTVTDSGGATGSDQETNRSIQANNDSTDSNEGTSSGVGDGFGAAGAVAVLLVAALAAAVATRGE